MKLVVVGSGTVVPHAERVCSGYYIETGEQRLLLDCGAGVVHHMARFDLPWSRLTHVALSHFHTDHVGDLPTLLFSLKHALPAPRTEPLVVLGPPGTETLIARFAAAFGDYVLDPGFPLEVQEIAAGRLVQLGTDLRLEARATPHTDASLAFRLHAADASLGYTGDTGEDPGLGGFFRGVGVLLAECSLPDEHAIASHLTPARVAALAREAAPGQLIVTHVYPQLEGRDVPALIRAAGWDGPVRVAFDGMLVRS